MIVSQLLALRLPEMSLRISLLQLLIFLLHILTIPTEIIHSLNFLYPSIPCQFSQELFHEV